MLELSWQASPRCFPYTIATRVKLCAMRNTDIGIWFFYIRQVSWGYPKPGSRPASKALPYHLQGSAATIGAPIILLEDSCLQAILKFHHLSSLDYKAHHRLPVDISDCKILRYLQCKQRERHQQMAMCSKSTCHSIKIQCTVVDSAAKAIEITITLFLLGELFWAPETKDRLAVPQFYG